MSERRFTPQEANALLGSLAPALTRLRDAHRTMLEHHEEVTRGARGNGGGGPGLEFLDASRVASGVLAELEDLGVLLRDPETGLIDFPAERDGREVYLCWRLGEERVEWWHPPETGIAGRQPL